MVEKKSVVTERMRLQIKVAKLSLLCRVAGLSFRDRMRSSGIEGGLGVELLPYCIERSRLRYCSHLTRMSPGQLSFKVFFGHD